MKRFVLTSLRLTVAFALLYGGAYWLPELSARVRDAGRNRRAYETVVRPAADWVRDFHRRHDRLPTQSELEDGAGRHWPGYSVVIYASPPVWQRTWGRPGADFMVSVSTGEWNLFRQSWDGMEWKAWNE